MDYVDKTLFEPFESEEEKFFAIVQLGILIAVKSLAERMVLQQQILWASIYMSTILMSRMPSILKDKTSQIRKNADDFPKAFEEIDAMIENLKKEFAELKYADRFPNNRADLIFFPSSLAIDIIYLYGLDNRRPEILLLSKLAAVCQVLSDVIGDQLFLDENILALYDSPEKKNMLFDWYNNAGILSFHEIKVLKTASPERSKFLEDLISDLENIRANIDVKFKLLESQAESIQKPVDLLFSGEFRDYDELDEGEKQQLHSLVDEALALSESLKCNLPIV